VGHYAIQFARLLGARQVIATVSSENKARLAREAGADAVVDYKHEDVAAQVRTLTAGLGADRVIEVDVAANGKLDADLLRPGGAGVVYGSGAGEFSLPFFPLIAKNLTLHFFIVYQLGGEERMRAQATLARLLGEGRLAHNVAQRLPLSQIVQAHEMVEAGQVPGNVVVTID
jgi:NADPH2:quinone reductase